MKVLMLHGIGGSAAIWGDEGSGTVAALTAAGHEAHALNLPGYGGAPGLPSMDSFVAAVQAAAAGQPVVLVGHSMGGMVAQEVAARSPQSVAALVLVCTSASFGKADGDWQARFVRERLAPLDEGLGMAGMAQRLVPGLVAPMASNKVRLQAMAVMSRVPEATYRAALAAIVAFDRREALKDLPMPCLLIAAEHDRTAPPDVMRRMAERIPGSEYLCLANAGHIANVEQPAAFHAALLDFSARIA